MHANPSISHFEVRGDCRGPIRWQLRVIALLRPLQHVPHRVRHHMYESRACRLGWLHSCANVEHSLRKCDGNSCTNVGPRVSYVCCIDYLFMFTPLYRQRQLALCIKRSITLRCVVCCFLANRGRVSLLPCGRPCGCAGHCEPYSNNWGSYSVWYIFFAMVAFLYRYWAVIGSFIFHFSNAVAAPRGGHHRCGYVNTPHVAGRVARWLYLEFALSNGAPVVPRILFPHFSRITVFRRALSPASTALTSCVVRVHA